MFLLLLLLLLGLVVHGVDLTSRCLCVCLLVFWCRFRELCVKTFMELRKSSHKIVLLVDMLAHGNEHLPCFSGKPHLVVESLRQRFMPDLHDRACIDHVHTLIDRSLSDWTTTCYDSYQRCFVGIL